MTKEALSFQSPVHATPAGLCHADDPEIKNLTVAYGVAHLKEVNGAPLSNAEQELVNPSTPDEKPNAKKWTWTLAPL